MGWLHLWNTKITVRLYGPTMPYFLCKFWQSIISNSDAFVVRILPISYIPKPVLYFWSHMMLSSPHPVLHPLSLPRFPFFLSVLHSCWKTSFGSKLFSGDIVKKDYKESLDHSIIPYILKSLWNFSPGRAALSFILSGLPIFVEQISRS